MEKIELNKLTFLNEQQSNKLYQLLKNLEEYDSKLESQNTIFEYSNSGFQYNADNLQKVKKINKYKKNRKCFN